MPLAGGKGEQLGSAAVVAGDALALEVEVAEIVGGGDVALAAGFFQQGQGFGVVLGLEVEVGEDEGAVVMTVLPGELEQGDGFGVVLGDAPAAGIEDAQHVVAGGVAGADGVVEQLDRAPGVVGSLLHGAGEVEVGEHALAVGLMLEGGAAEPEGGLGFVDGRTPAHGVHGAEGALLDGVAGGGEGEEGLDLGGVLALLGRGFAGVKPVAGSAGKNGETEQEAEQEQAAGGKLGADPLLVGDGERGGFPECDAHGVFLVSLGGVPGAGSGVGVAGRG
jgi:hypothetical protein